MSMATQTHGFLGVKHYAAEWLAEPSVFPSSEEAGDPVAQSRVSPQMLHLRARDLALSNGSPGGLVAQADYEQAKRELTGERDFDRQEAILRPIPARKP
jgi:hypothetical protein